LIPYQIGYIINGSRRLYGKKEKDNLSKEERNNIKKAIGILEKSLGGGKK